MPRADGEAPSSGALQGIVLELVADLAGSLRQPEVVRRVLEHGLRLAAAQRATLSRLTASEVIVEATVGAGGDVTWMGRAYPRDTLREQPTVWRALEERRAVLGGRAVADRALREFRDALDPVRHTAAVPLVQDDEPVGLLVLSRTVEVPFDDGDALTMELLGRVSAIAMANAAQYEATRMAAVRRAATIAAAEDIASHTGVGDVVARLLRHVVEAARADDGSLLRQDGDHVLVEATTGSTPAGTRFPIAPATVGAMESGAPVTISAADYLAGFPDAAAPVGDYRSFLVVPLAVAGRRVGVVALGRRHDAPFDAADIDAAHQMAPLASLLIRNARLLEDAREADRARLDYMSVAVHEMRAPLTVVRGYVGMIAGGDLGPVAPAVAGALQVVGAKAEELATTVDELLTAGQLEQGSFTLHPVTSDVADAVSRAVRRAQPRAVLHNGAVVAEVDGPCLAVADGASLDRVLDNLVNNAIAYRRGAPDVTLSCARAGEVVEVRVRDRGRGIPADRCEAVFGRFARLAPDVEGSGLGLYIGRALARLMKGELGVEWSVPDEGSTFLLTLPADG